MLIIEWWGFSEVLMQMPADSGLKPVSGPEGYAPADEADMAAGAGQFQRGRGAENALIGNRFGWQEGIIPCVDDERGCGDITQKGIAAGVAVIVIHIAKAVQGGGDRIVELPEGLQ